jgi:hypothetical protein
MPFSAVRRILGVYFRSQEFTKSENCLKFMNFVIYQNRDNINYSVLHNYLAASSELKINLKHNYELRE